MPKILKGHVAEAPEKVRFATGDSPRPGLKAINLQGSSSGNNTFYALKECPAALSVGIQVNEHRRFVWMPDQLPFMVKADRVGELVMHVPESAKIYADRVEQNVPSLSETIGRKRCQKLRLRQSHRRCRHPRNHRLNVPGSSN